MINFLNSVLSGLGTGSIYALVGLGFGVIVRTTDAFNFAQGQFVALGSLGAYTLFQKIGIEAAVACVLVIVAVAAVGAGVELVAIRPLARRDSDRLMWLLSTLGAATIITGISVRLWGSQPLQVDNYLPFQAVWVGQVELQSPYVLAIVGAIAVAVGLEVSERRTLWGRTLRAMGENRPAVELAGVNVIRAGLVAFMIGGAIAGFCGFLIAPLVYAQASSGLNLVLLAFASLAIGGFGVHWGALVGGWIVGISESLGGLYLGLQYSDVVVLGVLILVLLIRPSGLAGAGSQRLA